MKSINMRLQAPQQVKDGTWIRVYLNGEIQGYHPCSSDERFHDQPIMMG